MVGMKFFQVYATCSSLYIMFFLIFSSCKSFAYCLESSTNALIFCWFGFLFGLFILKPSHTLSIINIIGTLWKFQLVPEFPAPWHVLCNAHSFVFEQVLVDTLSDVYTLYSLETRVDACSLHILSGISNEWLHKVVKFRTIPLKHVIVSFCSFDNCR